MNGKKVRVCVHRLCIGGAAVIALLLPVQEPAAATSQSNFLPIFGSGTGEFVGLSLVNTAAVKNDVTVTWTDSDGKSARSASLSLAAGSQRVALAREILATPQDPVRGWLRIDSSEPGLLTYLTSGQGSVMDGTESVSLLSTRLVLPHVAVNTGFVELEYTDTLIGLINPGSAAANATAELISLDGKPAGSLAVPLPAQGSGTFRVSEFFHDTLPPNNAGGATFQGYLKITSDVGLAGWLQIDTPLSRRMLRGRASEEIASARLALVSHFAFGSPAFYQSELNLINVGNSAVTLDLVAQDDRGITFGSARRALIPGQGFRENVLSLLQIAVPAVYPPPLVAGYIRIRSVDGGTFQAIGDIDITRNGNAASMLFPVEAVFSSSLTIPFVISGSDYFTGYAIANPNELLTVQTDVTIELLDQDGRSVGVPRKVSLAPSARFVGLVEEKVRAGYIRMRANGPVALLGSMGTQDVSVLVPLPGLP